MRAHWSETKNHLEHAKPYWNYEDIGVFFLVLVLLGSVLRFLVRLHLLPRSELTDPSFGLQFAVVASLSLALYLVLKFRHHQPVLQPLGWVWPRTAHIVVALIAGVFACLRRCPLSPLSQSEHAAHGESWNCWYWAFVLGPILEESLFRGCLLPLLAQTTGNGPAVILTAILFALFHQPADLAHWVSFTATGIAYGWIRVASRSTAAAAVMHATYNLAVFLSATF